MKRNKANIGVSASVTAVIHGLRRRGLVKEARMLRAIVEGGIVDYPKAFEEFEASEEAARIRLEDAFKEDFMKALVPALNRAKADIIKSFDKYLDWESKSKVDSLRIQLEGLKKYGDVLDKTEKAVFNTRYKEFQGGLNKKRLAWVKSMKDAAASLMIDIKTPDGTSWIGEVKDDAR